MTRAGSDSQSDTQLKEAILADCVGTKTNELRRQMLLSCRLMLRLLEGNCEL